MKSRKGTAGRLLGELSLPVPYRWSVPGGGRNPRRGSPTLLRQQLQRVLRRPGQERRGLSFRPGIVAGLVEGRHRMAALSPGHVEEPFLLAARRDDETLGGSEAGALDAR